MYYRRSSYPAPGLADIPDDLWKEFQRIRGHLGRVDQNNVRAGTVLRDSIALPDNVAHNGVSDIVGADGGFLYSENPGGSSPVATIGEDLKGQWVDLRRGDNGVSLAAISRGPAPWIVAASVSARRNTAIHFADGAAALRLRSSGLRLVQYFL